MNAFAPVFDENVLRLATNPALSADAVQWRRAGNTMSASVSGDAILRQSHELFDAVLTSAKSGLQIDAETISQALAVLDALPTWAPSPEIVVESDGQIGFDWHEATDRVISLNVGRGGLIGYAALIGLESSYGRIPFAGVLPERIRTLLRRTRQQT